MYTHKESMFRTATASFTKNPISEVVREPGGLQSSWWDQHWEQGRLLRASSSVPWEDPLQDLCAEGCNTQLGSSSKEMSLGWSKERAEPWFCRSQRDREHGWGTVTSKWCVKRALQSASTLPPTSHPLQRGVSSQVSGMLLAWDCPTLSCVQAGAVVPGSSQSLFLIHWPGFVC